MKTLIAGWFSFEGMGATAGDLYARDIVADWLDRMERSYDVALAPPFDGSRLLAATGNAEGAVRWEDVDPHRYDEVIFVCGPFGNGPPVREFLDRFSDCRLIGVNLSLLQPLEEWDPFDLLLERDSTRRLNPDITFLADSRPVPVVGTIQVDHQEEYGNRALHDRADEAIQTLIDSLDVASVPIDTRLDDNRTGLHTPEQIESLIASMDVVITTRLHGTVLALKNGIPPIPIDPIKGGAKIRRQVETLEWPILFTADDLDQPSLQEALDFCLTDEARRMARSCAEHATRRVLGLRDEFTAELKRLRCAHD